MNDTVRSSAMTNRLSPASLIARSAAFARAMACPPDFCPSGYAGGRS